jgi:hypothetical protein
MGAEKGDSESIPSLMAKFVRKVSDNGPNCLVDTQNVAEAPKRLDAVHWDNGPTLCLQNG